MGVFGSGGCFRGSSGGGVWRLIRRLLFRSLSRGLLGRLLERRCVLKREVVGGVAVGGRFGQLTEFCALHDYWI